MKFSKIGYGRSTRIDIKDFINATLFIWLICILIKYIQIVFFYGLRQITKTEMDYDVLS